MRRTTALVGSLAVHGALIGALVVVIEHAPESSQPERAAVAIELVDLVEFVAPAPATTVAANPGGGTPDHGALQDEPARITPVKRVAAAATVRTSLAGISFESRSGDGGDGGSGGGTGGGIGAGDGRGLGGAGDDEIALPPPPPDEPPVAVSKARPAKLVYPLREREVDDGMLFIARVIVDPDGYVVGAKLVRGFGGPRDTEAADLIWRFRYSPARDESGRAVRSTFDQRFLVNR